MILLAMAAFVTAVLLLRLPRSGWALFGAALLFGLSGYALQGHPGRPGAPQAASVQASETGTAMVDARRELFNPAQPPQRFVTVADGFARRGQYADAAGILRGSLTDNPEDTEAWIALGNALVEHAEGQPTPAALYAYSRAEALSPDHPAAPYFLGVALLRAGRANDTRAVWAEMLADAPRDAQWVPAMRERLKRLDAMIAGMPGQ